MQQKREDAVHQLVCSYDLVNLPIVTKALLLNHDAKLGDDFRVFTWLHSHLHCGGGGGGLGLRFGTSSSLVFVSNSFWNCLSPNCVESLQLT